MKRNLKEEISKIIHEPILHHPETLEDGRKNIVDVKKQLLTLFSTTIDNVIGEKRIPNPPILDPDGWRSGIFVGENELIDKQRARKKLVLSDKEGELGL